jgi:hypothetical protein
VVPGLDIVAAGADAEDALAEAEGEILARQLCQADPSAPQSAVDNPNPAMQPTREPRCKWMAHQAAAAQFGAKP